MAHFYGKRLVRYMDQHELFCAHSGVACISELTLLYATYNDILLAIVEPTHPPDEWAYSEFNADPTGIADFLRENSHVGNTSVPNRQNRALLSDSMLFHQSDPFRFKKGTFEKTGNSGSLGSDRTRRSISQLLLYQ